MRAAIFDFDGVIVNSEPLHFAALRESLRPEGFTIREEEYLSLYLAYDDRGAIRRALEHHGFVPEPGRIETIADRKVAAFAALLPEIPFFPGVRELVRSLSREMPLAIASGARHEEIEAILAAGGLRDAFTAIVGAEDVSRGKPDPEPYAAAMARIAPRAPGLTPAECVAFEDSLPGILAARAAGMKVVAVTNSYPAAKLGVADHVLESLQGLDGRGLLELLGNGA
jgi:HAD superfamily hydrolase (TIGR01509 family)